MSKSAYRQAVALFMDVAAQVRPEQWDAPALGEWSVLDLVGHASRSITRVEEFGARRAPAVDVPSAAAHYRRSLGRPNANAQVAERGREAGRTLGADPLAAMREDWARAEQVLNATAEDEIIAYDNGGILFRDYLETRVFELVIHALDLANAVGVEAEPPRDALAVALRTLADLALESGRGAQLALAATGRGPLPDGFSALG